MPKIFVICNTEEVKKKRELIASHYLTKFRQIIKMELHTWQPFPFFNLVSDCQIWHDSAHKWALQKDIQRVQKANNAHALPWSVYQNQINYLESKNHLLTFRVC